MFAIFGLGPQEIIILAVLAFMIGAPVIVALIVIFCLWIMGRQRPT